MFFKKETSFENKTIWLIEKLKAYDTGSSQAVPHPSTIPARRCLTSVIGRERVFSSWYGRRHSFERIFQIYCQFASSAFEPQVIFETKLLECAFNLIEVRNVYSSDTRILKLERYRED